MEIVPIVNERGEEIGQETRKVAHEKGLLHPGVRVLVTLPDGKFVFQKRSSTKETNAGKLTFAATGHVQAGQSLVDAAVTELFEETGIKALAEDLTYLGSHSKDVEGGEIGAVPHRVFGQFFGYSFSGKLDDLVAEPGEVDGFEAYSMQELDSLTEKQKERFVPLIFLPEIKDILLSYENQSKKT